MNSQSGNQASGQVGKGSEMTREGLAYENPLGLLRMLKGCPLSVLIALAMAGQPVGLKWIVRVTGYGSTNTVQQALEYLEEIGLVTRSQRYFGWQLAGAAMQLPLVLTGVIEGEEAVDNSALPGENESQKLRLAPATTTTYLHSREQRLKAAVVERDSINETRVSKNETRAFAENLEALHAAGVRGKVAEQLAGLPYVTPAYVRAHALKVARDGDMVGLLVTRIRDGDPAPQHPKNCVCDDCERERRGRYVSGEYAEWIEH